MDGSESSHSSSLSGIMDRSESSHSSSPSGITVLADGETLLALGEYQSRSVDGGKIWTKLGWDSGWLRRIKIAFESKFVVIDNTLYLLSSEAEDFQIFRLSTDGDTLIPVQDVPIFDRWALNPRAISRLQTETATASRDAFYVEYQRGLFKWKLGDPDWTNTGLVDTYPVFDSKHRSGFKIAVSGKTVYVGQRDGHLFQSFDEGNSWKDVTSSLPLRFTRFNEITATRVRGMFQIPLETDSVIATSSGY